MKTFNEKDLITWSNREKAVIGNEYYFDDTVFGLKNSLNENSRHKLIRIDDNLIDRPFIYKKEIGDCYFACILPVDAVKEDKPREKKYRPFKDLYEFYKFIYPNSDFKREYFSQDMLLNVAFTYREKNKGLFTITELITRVEDGTVGGCKVISVNTRVLDYWFNKYEIMNTNGEWQPFGVLEE